MDPGDGHVLFDTEILTMNLTGSNPFGTGVVMIRESPTLPSHGRFQQLDPAGSFFRCDSFFDVFFEVSLDGGMTWNPTQTSGRISNPSVGAYPPNSEMFLGPPTDLVVQEAGSTTTLAIIRNWWWWWLPWYEYYVPYIDIPPPNTLVNTCRL